MKKFKKVPGSRVRYNTTVSVIKTWLAKYSKIFTWFQVIYMKTLFKNFLPFVSYWAFAGIFLLLPALVFSFVSNTTTETDKSILSYYFLFGFHCLQYFNRFKMQIERIFNRIYFAWNSTWCFCCFDFYERLLSNFCSI